MNHVLNSPWTRALNDTMQQKLAGTVWANYRLVTTQWPCLDGLLIFCHVTNSVAETYIQGHHLLGSCMNCHRTARTAGKKPGNVKADANFSFLLRMAQ